jgi:hypothetical protein
MRVLPVRTMVSPSALRLPRSWPLQIHSSLSTQVQTLSRESGELPYTSIMCSNSIKTGASTGRTFHVDEREKEFGRNAGYWTEGRAGGGAREFIKRIQYNVIPYGRPCSTVGSVNPLPRIRFRCAPRIFPWGRGGLTLGLYIIYV